jgi:hypothetical protein
VNWSGRRSQIELDAHVDDGNITPRRSADPFDMPGALAMRGHWVSCYVPRTFSVNAVFFLAQEGLVELQGLESAGVAALLVFGRSLCSCITLWLSYLSVGFEKS